MGTSKLPPDFQQLPDTDENLRPISRRILPRWRIEVTIRADFKSGFAPADDARIYFESAGAGPAVVFIHAGVSDRRMWDPQFDYFADRFHVVRYDLRGFGKSEMPDLSYSNRCAPQNYSG